MNVNNQNIEEYLYIKWVTLQFFFFKKRGKLVFVDKSIWINQLRIRIFCIFDKYLQNFYILV